jgi:predicted RNA-binding Zn-ribbon protein involved in translation (DUF1610 family)
MKVEEVFSAVGINSNGRAITDDWIRTTCPSCSKESRLSEAPMRESGQQSEYACPDCGTTVVIVGPAPGLTGYRLGDHVVQAVNGMYVDVPPL